MSRDGSVSGSYTTIRPRGSKDRFGERDRERVSSPDGEDLDWGASWARSSSVDRASKVEVETSVGVRADFGVDEDGATVFEVSTAGTEALLLCLE